MFMFYAPAVLLSPMTILLMAALIPPFILLVKVYRMDTIEKEPKGLIFRLVLAGALTVIPAGFLEGIGIGSILGHRRSSSYRSASVGGTPTVPSFTP